MAPPWPASNSRKNNALLSYPSIYREPASTFLRQSMACIAATHVNCSKDMPIKSQIDCRKLPNDPGLKVHPSDVTCGYYSRVVGCRGCGGIWGPQFRGSSRQSGTRWSAISFSLLGSPRLRQIFSIK